ncbi:MAG: prepilin-type N-terminal cleavage/methylation domain-containing protein [Kofleriaceae bacterium]|nr:prepilin-type N-terminal cleavage/methylation domain-containing protein [Myxococcales bacterium]MCB9564913.1 prepilin-type N-terminal cleavage/methylation domain-containing protein [Kofleriaceae bacterium]
MPRRPAPRRRRRAGRGQDGFTLFELLVTLAVSVIGMTGVVALQLATTRTNAMAAQTSDAVTIAKRTLEEARGKTLAQMYVDYEDVDAALPIDYDFGSQTVAGRTATYLRRIIVESTAASVDLLRIRVEVVWADEGADVNDLMHRHEISVELLRTRQEDF